MLIVCIHQTTMNFRGLNGVHKPSCSDTCLTHVLAVTLVGCNWVENMACLPACLGQHNCLTCILVRYACSLRVHCVLCTECDVLHVVRHADVS